MKPSDEHGDETEIIVSLQTVIDVYNKCNKSLQIVQYQIIQCMYMRHMGWGPGYNARWYHNSKQLLSAYGTNSLSGTHSGSKMSSLFIIVSFEATQNGFLSLTRRESW